MASTKFASPERAGDSDGAAGLCGDTTKLAWLHGFATVPALLRALEFWLDRVVDCWVACDDAGADASAFALGHAGGDTGGAATGQPGAFVAQILPLRLWLRQQPASRGSCPQPPREGEQARTWAAEVGLTACLEGMAKDPGRGFNLARWAGCLDLRGRSAAGGAGCACFV